MNVVPSAASEALLPKAWVFSDQTAVRQTILGNLGFSCVHFSRDLHTKQQLRFVLNAFEVQNPMVCLDSLGRSSCRHWKSP